MVSGLSGRRQGQGERDGGAGVNSRRRSESGVRRRPGAERALRSRWAPKGVGASQELVWGRGCEFVRGKKAGEGGRKRTRKPGAERGCGREAGAEVGCARVCRSAASGPALGSAVRRGLGRIAARLQALPPAASPPRPGDRKAKPGSLTLSSPPQVSGSVPASPMPAGARANPPERRPRVGAGRDGVGNGRAWEVRGGSPSPPPRASSPTSGRGGGAGTRADWGSWREKVSCWRREGGGLRENR